MEEDFKCCFVINDIVEIVRIMLGINFIGNLSLG